MNEIEAYWGDNGVIHLAASPSADFLCGLPNTGSGPIPRDQPVAAPYCPECSARRSQPVTAGNQPFVNRA